MRTLTPTGMSTSGERETFGPRCERFVHVDMTDPDWPKPDPVVARVYESERAKGRVYVQKACNDWRAEVGMPSRQIEVAQETVAATKELRAEFRRIHNPGAWDGRNNWEDAPTVGDALSPERYPFPLVAGRRAGKTLRLADMAATPIFDAVVRKHGKPPL